MKNAIVLGTPKDVREYIESQFKSDIFKKKTYKHSGITETLYAYYSKPRVVCEYSDPVLERNIFYSGMNMLPMRTYDNPLVHDLYLLHEMYHHVLLDGVSPAETVEQWADRSKVNEFEVSLFTECLVYYGDTALRAASFPHEIWADRFNRRPYNSSYQEFARATRAGRQRAYTNPQGDTEELIAKYGRANDVWVRIWGPRFKDLENVRASLSTDFFALATLDEIPFEKEVREFQGYLDER